MASQMNTINQTSRNNCVQVQDVQALLDHIHMRLCGWRSLKLECFRQQSKLDKSNALVSQAGRQIEIYNEMLGETVDFNRSCTMVIKESNKTSCRLVVKHHELEIEHMQLYADKMRQTNELRERDDHIEALKDCIDDVNSQLEEERLKTRQAEAMLDEDRTILASYEHRNRMLAGEIKDNTKCMKLGNMMHWCVLVDMELHLLDLQQQAKDYQEIGLELMRRNEELQRTHEEQTQLIQAVRNMRLAKRSIISSTIFSRIFNGILNLRK